jgi:hypothetical protein
LNENKVSIEQIDNAVRLILNAAGILRSISGNIVMKKELKKFLQLQTD